MLQSNVTLNVLSETGTGGFARGAGPLLRGEPAARQVPAPFAGARRASGVGGTRPPRLSPGGGNGKEGDQRVLLAAAGFYSSCDDKISLLIRSAQIHYNCSARKQRERWFRRHESGAGFRTEPRNTLLCYRFISSVRLSNRCPLVRRDPCLRLQLLHEPIPLIGYRNHYSASLG